MSDYYPAFTIEFIPLTVDASKTRAERYEEYRQVKAVQRMQRRFIKEQQLAQYKLRMAEKNEARAARKLAMGAVRSEKIASPLDKSDAQEAKEIAFKQAEKSTEPLTLVGSQEIVNKALKISSKSKTPETLAKIAKKLSVSHIELLRAFHLVGATFPGKMPPRAFQAKALNLDESTLWL